ncbi:NUDIX domain-containing protein [Patescibacteria group bacterium]|nr:NUDIX domain-containing protein [Patescibacteria group bacterium]
MDHHMFVRLRLVIIRDGQLLTSYTRKHNFYFYIGGHLEYGETIAAGCAREIREECGDDTEFTFKKILYIRDYFVSNENEHNVELFILGEINKGPELEGHHDPQHPDGSMWLSWLDLQHLPENLYPHTLSSQLLADYQQGFPNSGRYVGEII